MPRLDGLDASTGSDERHREGNRTIRSAFGGFYERIARGRYAANFLTWNMCREPIQSKRKTRSRSHLLSTACAQLVAKARRPTSLVPRNPLIKPLFLSQTCASFAEATPGRTQQCTPFTRLIISIELSGKFCLKNYILSVCLKPIPRRFQHQNRGVGSAGRTPR